MDDENNGWLGKIYKIWGKMGREGLVIREDSTM